MLKMLSWNCKGIHCKLTHVGPHLFKSYEVVVIMEEMNVDKVEKPAVCVCVCVNECTDLHYHHGHSVKRQFILVLSIST